MTQVSSEEIKQLKPGHLDMSDIKPIMEHKMDESRSWMGHKKSKTREHARQRNGCRYSRGYKMNVNKAWNNATMGKSKMGHDTSKTKARNNVLKNPSLFTKCCVGDCNYDTMDQFAAMVNITREEISQEDHLALLKQHIEYCHPQALEQASLYTKCCVGNCKYDTMDAWTMDPAAEVNITREDISQEDHFFLLKMHIEACHPQVLGQAPAGQLSHTPPTLAPKSGGARGGGSGLASSTFLWAPLWREPSLWKPAITHTSNPSPKKREEKENSFRHTSLTLQQEDRQV